MTKHIRDFEDPARHRTLIRELCKDSGREALRVSVDLKPDKYGQLHVVATHTLGSEAEHVVAKAACAALDATLSGIVRDVERDRCAGIIRREMEALSATWAQSPNSREAERASWAHGALAGILQAIEGKA